MTQVAEWEKSHSSSANAEPQTIIEQKGPSPSFENLTEIFINPKYSAETEEKQNAKDDIEAEDQKKAEGIDDSLAPAIQEPEGEPAHEPTSPGYIGQPTNTPVQKIKMSAHQ